MDIKRVLTFARNSPRKLIKSLRRRWLFRKYKKNPKLHGPLHPRDGMFTGNLDHYMHVAEDCILITEDVLNKAGKSWSDIKAVLDMPCGYGRELRLLVRKIDPAYITACDIMPEQIEFCEKEFKCKTFLSAEDFPSIHFPEKYDLIWVGSLFTHLDKDRFTDLLKLLFGALNPGGILIFTTHGTHSIGIFDQYWEKGCSPATPDEVAKQLQKNGGFIYYPYRYDSSFGISISLEPFVSSLCNSLFSGNGKILDFQHRRWDNHQDVFALQRIR